MWVGACFWTIFRFVSFFSIFNFSPNTFSTRGKQCISHDFSVINKHIETLDRGFSSDSCVEILFLDHSLHSRHSLYSQPSTVTFWARSKQHVFYNFSTLKKHMRLIFLFSAQKMWARACFWTVFCLLSAFISIFSFSLRFFEWGANNMYPMIFQS